jgi:hypothetical protein
MSSSRARGLNTLLTYNENRPKFITYSKLDYGRNLHLDSGIKFSKYKPEIEN